MREAVVLGVDRERGAWVGAMLPVSGAGRFSLVRAPGIRTLIERARRSVEVVGVDIPIGLPDEGPRQADVLTRAELADRKTSVFSTPVRPAIEAGTYEQAQRVSKRIWGKGLTRQSYLLRDGILDVDRYLRRGGEVRVVEVFPEISFTRMRGRVLEHSKKTDEGVAERVEALAAVGIEVPREVDLTRRGVHDVLDAAASAWSAARVARGEAESLPDPPETFSDGLEAAIRV